MPQSPPREPSRSSAIFTVMTWLSAELGRNTLATRRSFQVHRKLEDRERGECGEGQRQHDLDENLEVGARRRGRLDDVRAQADHVVAQQIDGQWQAEAPVWASQMPQEALPMPDLVCAG